MMGAITKEIQGTLTMARHVADRFASTVLRLRRAVTNERMSRGPDRYGDDDGMSEIETQARVLEYLFHELDEIADPSGFVGMLADLSKLEADAKEVAELRERTRYERHSLTDPEIRATVWALTDGHCAYCGNQLEPDKANGHAPAFCVEHVVPRSVGGPDNIANYVPSCLGCNSSKGDRHVLTFIRGALARRTGLSVVNGGAA